jgi:ferritin-like metal-binding protein YciE
MTVSNLRDLLVEQLRDLYNAETQVQLALERWAGEAGAQEMKQLFTDHLEQTSRHINRVQQICNALDVSPAGEKCHGMEGLITEGDTFLEDAEAGPVRDAGLIANAQRIEHYNIAGYGCARSYAKQLGLDEAAKALQRNLDESARMDERMTELAERLVNPEAVEMETA